MSVIILHLILVSSFGHWWGGFSFGPRFTTGLVPWFVLTAIIGVRARLNYQHAHPQRLRSSGRWLESTAGALLLIVSVAINGCGATSWATWPWNTQPQNVDEHPERFWDWRQPQFMAGLIAPPLPKEFPLATTEQIKLNTPNTNGYLGYGWSGLEPEVRWTDG